MTTTVNIRLDDELKKSIEALYDGLGLDISTATRMFYKQCLRENGLPFLPRMNEDSQRKERLAEGRRALNRLQEESVRNGTDNLSLDEINDVIATSRRERRSKRKKQVSV